MLPVQKIWLNHIYIMITINQWHKFNWTKTNILKKAYLYLNFFQKVIQVAIKPSLGFGLLMGVADDIVNTDHSYPLNVFADYAQLLFFQLVWIQLLHIKDGVSFVVKTFWMSLLSCFNLLYMNKETLNLCVCLSLIEHLRRPKVFKIEFINHTVKNTIINIFWEIRF